MLHQTDLGDAGGIAEFGAGEAFGHLGRDGHELARGRVDHSGVATLGLHPVDESILEAPELYGPHPHSGPEIRCSDPRRFGGRGGGAREVGQSVGPLVGRPTLRTGGS